VAVHDILEDTSVKAAESRTIQPGVREGNGYMIRKGQNRTSGFHSRGDVQLDGIIFPFLQFLKYMRMGIPTLPEKAAYLN
jgi:hypothetical protein